MARRRVPVVAVATLILAALVVAAVVTGRRPRSAEAAALERGEPTGQFEIRGTKFFDPDGVQFVPVGTNMNGPHSFFGTRTQGQAAALKAGWGFNFIRLVTCLPGGCHGPDNSTNNDLDGIVAEYTAQKMVVMIDYHQLGFGATASPADVDDAAAFWTDIAQRYEDNPYVWFNLFNEPEGGPGAAARWRTQHQPVIDAIRSTGATNIIVIDDTQAGQGAADWWSIGESPDTDSGVLSEGPNLVDPVQRLAFDVHPYDVWGFPNDNDPTCRTRYTDEQRDARFTSYVQRVYQRGFPLMAAEFGFRSGDSATSGVSYHGDLSGNHPPCGSTNLLAAETAYRVAPRFDLGMAVWPGFPLTSAGTENYDLDGDPPTNLTHLGELHYAYSRYQAERVAALGGSTDPPTTASPTTATEPPTTDPPTTASPTTATVPPTTVPPTTVPATTVPPTTETPTTETPTTVPPSTAPPAVTVPPSTAPTTTAPGDPQTRKPPAVLVVGDPAALTPGDQALLRRLRSRAVGDVTVVDDAEGDRTAGVKLAVIAPSVDPPTLGAQYRDAPVPVLHLAAGGWVGFGVASGDAAALSGNRLTWEGPGRAVPGGSWWSPRGNFRALFGAGGLWGVPRANLGAGAVPLLSSGSRGDPSGHLVEVAYPFASVLANGGCAPARRVALGIGDDAVPRLTNAGWATVDAAVAWLVTAG